MINFLHTFNPNPTLLSFGFINIYWYGLFVVVGILLSIIIMIKLASFYNIDKKNIIDLIFWLIIGGIIGTRIYHIFLEFPYYLKNPLNALKIWNGGLAIHGGIIAGLIIIYYFSKKHKINFWVLTSIIVPGVALGQAIGRWGNYFNQELFGSPTTLPWGIPINILNRPIEYLSNIFFHPTFLYESIGSLIIFSILIGAHIYIIKKNKINNFSLFLIFAFYLTAYSILRFALEFIKVDTTIYLGGLRWAQVVSLFIIFLVIILISFKIYKKTN